MKINHLRIRDLTSHWCFCYDNSMQNTPYQYYCDWGFLNMFNGFQDQIGVLSFKGLRPKNLWCDTEMKTPSLYLLVMTLNCVRSTSIYLVGSNLYRTLQWCWWNLLTPGNHVAQIGPCDRSRMPVRDLDGTSVKPLENSITIVRLLIIYLNGFRNRS